MPVTGRKHADQAAAAAAAASAGQQAFSADRLADVVGGKVDDASRCRTRSPAVSRGPAFLISEDQGRVGEA